MVLKIIGSSSLGNCYILESDTEALIIECGLPVKEIKKALDFNISKVVGVLQSHSHADHSKYWKEYAQSGIKVFMGPDALIALSAFHPCVQAIFESNKSIKLGGFHIQWFPLVHSVKCFGFLISHEETGKILFATDTEYIKYKFKDIRHMIVEANYSKKFLGDNSANRNHVLTGHMEIETTKEFVINNKNDYLQNVVLIHLSSENSNEIEFVDEIKKIVSCNVVAANKGIEVELRKDLY